MFPSDRPVLLSFTHSYDGAEFCASAKALNSLFDLKSARNDTVISPAGDVVRGFSGESEALARLAHFEMAQIGPLPHNFPDAPVGLAREPAWGKWMSWDGGLCG
jgi:hypothetical protein